MITPLGHIINVTANDLSGHVVFDFSSMEHQRLRVFFDGKEIASSEGSSRIEIQIPNPRIWSLSSPFLYAFRAESELEVAEGRFGIRTLSTQGKYITLNGTPIFVRGYIRGAAAHEHGNDGKLPEKEFYRKNIRQAKSFGFNMVRFHSTVPSDLFFEAADEEGILVHIEMRPPHDLYNNLEEMVEAKKDFVKDEYILDLKNRLFNHPSFAVYCIGNEIKNLSSYDRIEAIGRLVKKEDPTRLYIDTCAWGQNGRPIVDFDVQHLSYFFPYGKHAGMYDDTKNLQVVKGNEGKDLHWDIPLLAHEVCHYAALRDFKALKEKFAKSGTAAPWWIDEELKLIREKGYDSVYPEMLEASKHFQSTCWKIAYEAMRSSKFLGGFHFLQFADTDVYENSNGVVDCFDDVSYIRQEEFLRYNGDIVLLADISSPHFFGGTSIKIPVSVSRFDDRSLQRGTLHYSLSGEKIHLEGELEGIDLSKHDHYKIGTLSLLLPRVEHRERCALDLSLAANGVEIGKNRYDLFLYPRQAKMSYSEFLSQDGVTGDLDEALVRLKEGKDTILIYRSDWTRHLLHKDMTPPTHAIQATWNRFKPVIWDRGTNFGGLIDIQKLKDYHYRNKYLDLNFSILTEDCDKIILDKFPGNPTNLISGIDKCNRDRFDAYKGSFNLPELMGDRTLRNFSYLLHCNVSGASLLLCGMNLQGLDEDEPSSNDFAHFLLKYQKTAGKPKDAIPFEAFERYCKESAKAPVKERMMTQFWELDDAPVESAQYWIDSRAYLTND